MELSLKGPSEYKITDDNFRLARYDTDDFEVLCTATPGFICSARLKVCYTVYPDTKILTTCSEPFVLTFPESGSACNKPDKLLNYIIGESLEDDLKTLINYKGCLSEDDDGELRVYLREPLSDIRLQDIEKQLKTSGVTLLGPVSQDYCCLFISFRYNEATLLALSDIEVPRPGGWQLFDSKAMQKQREYDHKELNDASQR